MATVVQQLFTKTVQQIQLSNKIGWKHQQNCPTTNKTVQQNCPTNGKTVQQPENCPTKLRNCCTNLETVGQIQATVQQMAPELSNNTANCWTVLLTVFSWGGVSCLAHHGAKMKNGSRSEKRYQIKQNLLDSTSGQKSKAGGKSEKRWTEVKSATKKANSAKMWFWAKIKGAEQKWKAVSKSEKRYQKS